MTIQDRIREAKENEFVTVEQLALLLQYQPNTIYRWVRAGKIPGVRRFGRSIRFNRAVALSWNINQSRRARPLSE
jgi:excisionase family DNA binding protein